MKKILAVVAFIFILAHGLFAQADTPAWLKDFPPEGVLWGIGVAKTESDGESILLAEDRARTSIARQLTRGYSGIASEDQSLDIVTLDIVRTSEVITGSRVIRRYKGKDGSWWCLVELSKADATSGSKPAPPPDDTAAMLPVIRSNRGNWPDIQKAVTLNDIPSWIFNAGPQGVMCGVGAAKLDNGEDAARLAMERARRSLARSISAEINSFFIDYTVGESVSYQEGGVSITSVYEHTPIPLLLLNQAKTRDGTFWVMVGYRAARR